ncbi:MAG: phosphoribosylanthranilate isomerase [Prevotella sp.]|jgi:phosphoribosylanthranilate isomerase|nr:phosphoribosylanthranilate isomerase [Prevotella sp.]
MLIKVCGMREADNIRAVDALSTDFMGFIFWPHSSRYVAALPACLPQRAKRVGVFVDADMADLLQHAAQYGLHAVQLHGHENPAYVRQLRASVGQLTVIKAFNIATPNDLEQTVPYEGLADYFLFDTKGPSVGGNGKQFDWTVLNAYNGTTPFLLSGGIGPDDAPRIRSFHHPLLAGIDLNSRFETSPAVKDINQLNNFIKTIRQ